MFGLSRTRLALAAVLGLALFLLAGAGAGWAADFKRVPIETFDGVKLEGTFYPNPGAKKDACVLLLHNFDRQKGGDSHSDGWDHLAEKLQEKGYVVLSFDFRGFGQSKTLGNPMKFWAMGHNKMLKGAEAAKLPETIDQKKFPVQYYTYLINDIAAAKAFLDRQNDAGACNTSNLIVIGAGDGAALGALWLEAQSCLWRDRNQNPLGGVPVPDDPEIKDMTAAVWLSLSPTIAGRQVPLKAAFKEVGRENKVPIAFLYGQKDAKGANIAKAYLAESKGATGNQWKMTAEKAIADTDLVGSKLLQEGLPTEDLIVNKYLENVLELRGNPARKARNPDKSRFFWTFPKPGAPGAQTILAKPTGDEQPGPIPLEKLGVVTGP